MTVINAPSLLPHFICKFRKDLLADISEGGQEGIETGLHLSIQVKDQCGRTALSGSLNRILVEHIRASLPTVRTRLEEALEKCNTELRVYGDAPPGQTNTARWS